MPAPADPRPHDHTTDHTSHDRTGPYTPAPPLPPPELPGYEIVGELGRGGMGVVYRARQTALNREVAVKVVLAGAHATADQLVRFLAEAETAARLRHQGIVQIFESGRQAGLPFFSMEFVDGGSLADRVRRTGPLPPAEAAALGARLADAVQAAHDQGVVHRDLKPGNILLTTDGRPKVTDFGLARRLDVTGGLTATHAVIGTPNYMAPEQAKGESAGAGPAADVYALGAVLYECLAGRPAFRGTSAADTLSQVLNQPPASLRPAAVPTDLETVVLKCLEKEPGKRYPTAGAVADDLRRWLDGRPITARRIGPAGRAWRWAKRNPVVATLLSAVFGLLLVVAVGSTLGLLQIADARRRERDTLTDVRRQVARLSAGGFEIHTRQGNLSAALHWAARAWAADRDRGADYDPAAEPDHQLRVACSLEKFPELVGVAFVGRPVLDMDCDPAGRRAVVVVEDSTAQLWNLDTGEPLFGLPHPDRVTAVVYAPDGSTVATAAGSTVTLWVADTGQKRHELRYPAPVGWVGFRPDGKQLVTAAGRVVTVWDAATGQPVGPPIDAGAEVHYAAFSPDGGRLVTATTTETARVWDAASGKPVSDELSQKQPTRPSEDADDDLHIRRRLRPAFGPGGRSLLFTAAAAAVLWTEGAVRRFPFPEAVELGFQAALAPDGTRAVLTGRGRGTTDVWVLDVTAGTITKRGPRLPREISGVALPPAGPLCAFSITAGALYFRDTVTGHDGPAPVRCGRTVSRFRFAADGRRLVLASQDGTVRAVAVPGTDPAPGYAFDCGHADRLAPPGHRFSRDGTTAAIETPDGVRVGPRTGPGEVTVGKAGSTPIVFTPDGRHLVTLGDTGLTVWDWRAKAAVLSIPGGVLRLALSLDGRRLAVLRPDRELEVWAVPAGGRVFGPTAAPRVGTLGLNPTGNRVVVFAWNDTIDTWDVDAGVPLPGVDIRRDAIFYDADFAPLSGRFATATTDLLVRQWDADVQRAAGPAVAFGGSPPEYVGHAADERRLFVSDLTGRLFVFAAAGQLLGTAGPPTVTRLPTGRTAHPDARVTAAGTLKAMWPGLEGRAVYAHFGGESEVKGWRLPAYRAGLDEVTPLAVLASGFTADAEGNVLMLDPDEYLQRPAGYRRAWRTWRGLDP